MSRSSKEFHPEATIHNDFFFQKYFTILPNSTFEDPNISWAAKGLLGYIVSRPQNWHVYAKQLSKVYKGEKKGNGLDATWNLLKELRNTGYIVYQKSRNEKGQWIHKYHVYPMPVRQLQKMFPDRDYPGMDDPGLGNPGILTRKEGTSTDRNKKVLKESIYSTPPEIPTAPKVDPPPPLPIDSIPSCRSDISIENPEVLELIELEPQYCQDFRASVLSGWLKKWGPTLVLETIKLFLQTKSKQKKPIAKPEAWMEEAFKKQYVKKNSRCIKNKAFAEMFKNKYNLRQLKINKRFCIDTETQKDWYYDLPIETFESSLKNTYG